MAKARRSSRRASSDLISAGL